MGEIESELAIVKQRLAAGGRAIARQQAEIARLEKAGMDITEARKTLGRLHAQQLELASQQERLEKELARRQRK